MGSPQVSPEMQAGLIIRECGPVNLESPAEIIDAPVYGVWRRWKYDWNVPIEPGQHILKSRAEDSAGNVQPAVHDGNYGSYVIHHTVGIEVVAK